MDCPSYVCPRNRAVSSPRLTRKGFCAGVALVAATAGMAAAQKQKPRLIVPVRPEFLVSARSLVTERLDRSRVIETIGAVSPKAAAASDLGEASKSKLIRNIQLVLNRPAERQAAFDAQAEALHKPGSPSFHHWLTPAQVGAEFGPSDSDISTLTSFLQAEGFTVTTVGSGHTYVDFQGSVAQVEKTFHTTIHDFQLADGTVHFSATKEASIPEALGPLVVGFAGLSDIPAAKTMIAKPIAPAAETAREGKYVFIQPKGKTPLDTVSTTNYAEGPQDFYTIYNVKPLLNASTPIVGTGVTIALLEQVRINTADVTTFRTNFGVVPNAPVSLVTDYGYTGGNTTANTCTDPGALTSASYNDEGEAVLDTEWAGSAAPGANLLYVACASGAIPLGTVIAAEVVVDNNLADIMSMSYGLYENYNAAEDTLVNQLWEQAASQGQAVVISSGDSGSTGEDGNYGDPYAKYGITVSGIASTAWNVSAGGTDFEDEFDTLESDTAYGLPMFWNTATSTSANGFSSALSYVPEMTWEDSCGSSVYSRYYYNGVSQANPATFCGANVATRNVVGGGGGPSKLHARPTWQTGTVYGLPTTTAQPNRLQPDVSLFASNGFWDHTLPMYESDNGGYGYEGGTSFVAPQLAGVFALVQQQTGERLGQPNYVLYAMAGKAFGTTTASGACSSSGSTYDAPATAVPLSSCIFYDVQVGTNSAVCKSGGTNCTVVTGKTYGIISDPTVTGTVPTPAYKAGIGYDMGTGIGSMNIANLVTNWQNTTSGQLYAPSVALTPGSSTVTFGTPVALTATVSGPGSFPTGSVAYTATTVGALGTAPLTQSAGCANNGTCTESSVYTVNTSLTPGTYTVTATYTPTNENYTTGAQNTATITITAASVNAGNTASTTVAQGGTVTLTFIQGYPGTVAPTGAVSIMVNGSTANVGPITCVNKSKHTNCGAPYTAPANMATGNYPVTFTQAADANYMATSESLTLSVTAPTQ